MSDSKCAKDDGIGGGGTKKQWWWMATAGDCMGPAYNEKVSSQHIQHKKKMLEIKILGNFLALLLC